MRTRRMSEMSDKQRQAIAEIESSVAYLWQYGAGLSDVCLYGALRDIKKALATLKGEEDT